MVKLPTVRNAVECVKAVESALQMKKQSFVISVGFALIAVYSTLKMKAVHVKNTVLNLANGHHTFVITVDSVLTRRISVNFAVIALTVVHPKVNALKVFA